MFFILLTLAVQEWVALQRDWEALVVDHDRLLVHVEVGEVKDGALTLDLIRIETVLNGFGWEDTLNWCRVLVECILDHLWTLFIHGLWIFSLLLVDSNVAFFNVVKHSVE